MQVWDTTGKERFLTLTRTLYGGVIGALLVYDITNAKSFENLPT